MNTRPLYQAFASAFNAWNTCVEKQNKEWILRHSETITKLEDFLPSGAGVDAGVRFNYNASKDDKLVFDSSFHLLNDAGYYICWIDFTVTVTPSLIHDINLDIVLDFIPEDEDEDSLLDYLHDVFHHCLTTSVRTQKTGDTITHEFMYP